jgi:hypothetical protein
VRRIEGTLKDLRDLHRKAAAAPPVAEQLLTGGRGGPGEGGSAPDTRH